MCRVLFHFNFYFYPGTSTSTSTLVHFQFSSTKAKAYDQRLLFVLLLLLCSPLAFGHPLLPMFQLHRFPIRPTIRTRQQVHRVPPQFQTSNHYTPLLLPSYSYNNPSTARATSKTTSTTPRARPPPTPISNVSPQCRGTTRSNGCSTKHQCDQCHPTPTDETTSQSNSSFCNTA